MYLANASWSLGQRSAAQFCAEPVEALVGQSPCKPCVAAGFDSPDRRCPRGGWTDP
jgi:hypothetical protein